MGFPHIIRPIRWPTNMLYKTSWRLCTTQLLYIVNEYEWPAGSSTRRTVDMTQYDFRYHRLIQQDPFTSQCLVECRREDISTTGSCRPSLGIGIIFTHMLDFIDKLNKSIAKTKGIDSNNSWPLTLKMASATMVLNGIIKFRNSIPDRYIVKIKYITIRDIICLPIWNSNKFIFIDIFS